MRPDVNAGPIERSRSPLNVGVDIGSRGVGDASGVGVALALGDASGEADGVGDGEGDGCWPATLTTQTTNNDITSSARAHAEVVIKGFSFFELCIETIRTPRIKQIRVLLTLHPDAYAGNQRCAAKYQQRLSRYKPGDAHR